MPSNSMAKLLINASRIKYSVLDELFKDIKIQSDTVNLFIDGHYLFYRLLKESNASDVYASEENEIIMEIVLAVLNTIGHYRRYIATRLGKSNRIFLVMNRKVPKYQGSLIHKYGKTHYETYDGTHKDYGPINVATEKAIEFISGLIPYFEDVFMIDSSGVEETVAMSYIMGCEEAQGDFNIIYTRNEMSFQLMDDHCVVLFPRRDESKIITAKTWSAYVTRTAKYEAPEIPVQYIPIYLSICGLKCRDIPSCYLRGSVNAIKTIKNLIDSGEVKDDISGKVFLDVISNLKTKKERKPSAEEAEIMRLVYKAVYIPACIAALTDAQKTKILSSIYNLYDQVGLEKINEKLIEFDDVLDITNLNMNRVNTRNTFWNFDEEVFF